MRLRTPRWLRFLIFGAALLAVLGVGGGWTLHYLEARDRPARAARLAEALGIGPGARVAEIGAGAGEMAVEMARIVGPSGEVIATEVRESQLEDIRRAARRAGLTNVTVLLAGEHDSNLPAGCCDAVYMQRVYHHLTDPAGVIASIARALKPEARLAVLDFEPSWIANHSKPAGVRDRGGHGVPKEMLLREMKEFGFQAVGEIEPFGDEVYLAVFRR
jgi:ubiquinone/menaquinone biosynthesis C-methylase UbiE